MKKVTRGKAGGGRKRLGDEKVDSSCAPLIYFPILELQGDKFLCSLPLYNENYISAINAEKQVIRGA